MVVVEINHLSKITCWVMLPLTSLWALYTNMSAWRQSATAFVPLLQCLSPDECHRIYFCRCSWLLCVSQWGIGRVWLCCGFPLSGVTNANAVLIHCLAVWYDKLPTNDKLVVKVNANTGFPLQNGTTQLVQTDTYKIFIFLHCSPYDVREEGSLYSLASVSLLSFAFQFSQC